MFDVSFDRVIGSEGSYTNDRNDRGNWTSGKIGVGQLKGTKYGISAMSYPKLDIKNLSLDEAKEIYRRDYWDKYHLNELPDPLAYQVFDALVNQGSNGIKFLQRAINELMNCSLVVDGIIGNNTINSVKSIDDINSLVHMYIAKRLDFYNDIKTFNTYGRGWVQRMVDNIIYAINDLK